MRTKRRAGFTLFQLLLVLVLLVILIALLLPGLAYLRIRAAQAQSQNNMKQLGLAAHNSHDTFNHFPSGNDANSFSATAHLLPFVEQAALYNTVDFKKSVTDKANEAARKTRVRTFESPADPVASVSPDYGPTNYLWCAGSKAALADNDGIFYQNSKTRIAEIVDGTSNTVMTGETLKGDGGVRAIRDVRRQHVRLGKGALKGLKRDAGVDDFKNDKNIAADRCASWMDGRFLQGTFTGTLIVNDARPDVNCAGLGGVSGLRRLHGATNIGMADGSVRVITPRVDATVWSYLASRNDGNVIPEF